MPRILACPVCRSRMRVPDDSGGRKTRCPHCARPLRVPKNRPGASAAPAAPVPAPSAAPPTLEDVVLDLDLAGEAAPEKSPARPPVPPPPAQEGPIEDDVLVVEDEVIEDGVVLVEEEGAEKKDRAAADDDALVEVVDGADPLEILAGGDEERPAARPAPAKKAKAPPARLIGVALAVLGVGLLGGVFVVPSGADQFLYRAVLAGIGLAVLAGAVLGLFAGRLFQRKAAGDGAVVDLAEASEEDADVVEEAD